VRQQRQRDCRADREPCETRLGDWGIEHAVFAKLFHETVQHFEGGACLGNVLPQHEHGRIAAQLFCQRLLDGFAEK